MNLIVVTSTKQNIKFGYEGEDNVTKIIFPYDESWLEYGEGNFEVRILRCGDEVAYTATDVVDDRQAMTLTMTVTDIELSVRGRGEMQLCYVCPDSIKKSPIYQYTVNRSVDYKYAVDPPEGSIIASVEKSLSEIKNTTNRLSNSVISIESSINDVNSQIDNINNKISKFDEEIDSVGEVETKVDNLETSIESINGRINTAEGNINENTESISDLNESVTELENKKVTDLETSGGKSDSGKYLTVGTDGKIKATSLTIPPKITVDESLSTTSKNPVQNKVIKTELNNINSNIATCNTEISKINGSLVEQANTIDRVEMDEIESLVYKGLTVTKCTVANGTIRNPANKDAVNTFNYIPCAAGDTVTIYPVRTPPEGHEYKYAYVTYNENKQIINDLYAPLAEYKTVTIKKTSVKFIRFSIFEFDETDTIVSIRADAYHNTPVAITRSGNVITDLMAYISDVIHETDISDTVSWSIGGIGTGGENYPRNYAIRSTYIPVVNSISLDADYVAWCSFYDENHEFIKRIQNLKGDLTVKDVISREYAYLRLEVRYAPNDTDDTTPITDTSRSEHVRLYKATADVYAESIWSKYDRKRYEDLISQSKYAYDSNGRVLTLLHFSDIHNDSMGMKFALDVYDSLSHKIDDIIHTGDTVTGNYSDGISNWILSGCADRVLNVIGNHDTEENLVLQAAGKDNVYNTFFAPYISNWGVVQPSGVDDSESSDYHALYYYKDYDTPKIRLIVLDTNFWDSAQSAWLTETLASAKEDGYAIILACHNVKKLTEMTDSNFSTYKGDGITENTNAYANQPDNWLDPVADFIDAGGEFICVLAGHNHAGHMGYLTLYPDIFCYVSDKASVARTSGAARISGENNENTVNIVTVNVTEKLFKIVKIGAEVDGKMRGRHVFCYDYANKRIISQW